MTDMDGWVAFVGAGPHKVPGDKCCRKQQKHNHHAGYAIPARYLHKSVHYKVFDRPTLAMSQAFSGRVGLEAEPGRR